MNDNARKIAATLLRLLHEVGQGRVAASIGRAESAVSRALSGENRFTLDQWSAVLAFLGLDVVQRT